MFLFFSFFQIAKFVDDKMPDLVQDTCQVMAIIDEVRHMFHKEAYSTIKAEKTTQEKMRALYDGPFRSGGEELKAAVYDALKKHEPQLMRRLGTICSCRSHKI